MATSTHNTSDTVDIKAIESLNRIIHEPARLMLMSLLSAVSSADYTFLMSNTGLTWGNLSSHLMKLEESGYIEIEKSFVGKKPRTMVTLSREGKRAFETYIRTMKNALGI